ncbi:MAG: hypothetical protein EBV06_04705 [Planctomycetia bacterium]|nr:hypothetical protein [Planctomycetia bacterium]
MKTFRSHAPETIEAVALLNAIPCSRRPRASGPDVSGMARCPCCGFEVIVRMGRNRPVLWCRCIARSPRPAA